MALLGSYGSEQHICSVNLLVERWPKVTPEELNNQALRSLSLLGLRVELVRVQSFIFDKNQ